MKKFVVLLSSIALISSLQSCKDKDDKLVEVDIPETVEDKVVLPNPEDVKSEGKFQMPGLSYAYDALEPVIDAKTMEIHYSKHHLAYTNNLNKAIVGTVLENQTIEEILSKLDLENKVVRNNAGGYFNHNLFWEIIAPSNVKEPQGLLAEDINKSFGSFDKFKELFSEAAMKQFGSGWAWLVVDKSGKLVVGATPNQDNPMMPGMNLSGTPILGLDVWEHAYYLNYQNQRQKYVDEFFSIINWDVVSTKYQNAIQAKVQ